LRKPDLKITSSETIINSQGVESISNILEIEELLGIDSGDELTVT